MPNTSLQEAAPTTSLREATRTLLLYERLRQRRRSVQVSTSAPCPMPLFSRFLTFDLNRWTFKNIM
ncbi:MAG: hypothetical protein ACYTX0_32220, partial [Nostoc sp.]